MYIKLYDDNPNSRDIQKIVSILKEGGIIIYPTDTVYGIGCDIYNQKAVEKVARLKGVKVEKSNFSFICYDLSHLSEYARQVSNPVFKLMKKNLPGPFTFILHASNSVPKIFKNKKKTVGIRVPANNIIREIVKALEHPILTTSIRDKDDLLVYSTDPELIYEQYKDNVDIVIDGGYGNLEPSTIVDCTNDDFEIIRQGKGQLEF